MYIQVAFQGGARQCLVTMPASLADQLEASQIITYDRCPHGLPSDDDLRWLREALPLRMVRKNVSYYPDGDRLVGASADTFERCRAILRAHAGRVQSYLKTALGSVAEGWRVGTSSFRPLQERGRKLNAHASNELVHIDAGAYGATHGDRILRFFTNIHPSEDRVWVTKGDFSSLYAKYAAQAGIARVSLRQGPFDQLYSAAVRALGALTPAVRMIDSSPYDRAMRRFHNFMKDTPAFQADLDGHREVRFAPFSSWAVLTDSVSHACTSGQFALVDTFVLRLDRCRHRERAPFHVMSAN